LRSATRHSGALGALALVAASPFAASPAAAAEGAHDPLTGRGYLAIGSFANSTALDIRLDGVAPGALGTEFDWDQRFGLQDAKRFRVDGVWRFTPKHHLRLLYTDYAQNDRGSLDTAIQWGDELIPVGAQVTAGLGFEVIEAAYEYAFISTPRAEVSGSVGLHYTTLEARLSAVVTAGGAGGTRTVGGPRSVAAPLPVVGARGMWRLGEQVYLDAQAQYFSLAIDDIKGSLYNYRAALVWQPTRRIGLGLGYDAFGVDVDLRQDDFRGKVDWVYRGPQAFVSVAF
jgi:hypothetical protein